MRYLDPYILDDLKKKMVFISGPRQVGKTTLALSFLKEKRSNHPAYLNWDRKNIRAGLIKGELPPSQPLLVFDEIHKYKSWKNLIKGFWDTEKDFRKIIVTGSAMLNIYRHGQDSLLGRYHHYRLHPFSINEAITQGADSNDLLALGGFPEPFLSGSERSWKRWSKERLEKIVYEDIRDLENVKTLELIQLLAEELPRKVGAPLSIQSLSTDIEKAHATINSWLNILEKIYYCYRIAPYGAPKIRAVKKEAKLYLWDWREIENPAFRFENMVASHLLKYCHFLEDTEGERMELRFLRDTDGREIDFVVLKNRKPVFAVECKTGDQQISPRIAYYKARTTIPLFYQVHLGKKDFGDAKTAGRVLPFVQFCKELQIP